MRRASDRKLNQGLVTLVALTVLGLGACGGAKMMTAPMGGSGGAGGAGGSGTDAGDALPDVGQVTYYKDVGPLFDTHCVACHTPGGIGPFSLASYDDAMKVSGLLPSVTKARTMPPWPPAAGCGDFRNARVLTLTEIAMLDAWEKQGAPAGDPATAPPKQAPSGPNLGTPSATLDPGAPYHPNDALTDDYHCTLIDPGLAAAQDLIGFNIHPDSSATVHHVLLFEVPQAKVASVQAQDAAEAGAGWTCFGGTGVDGTQTIGGWVPGSGTTAFPAPTGIHLEAGTQIVMQVHYNLLASKNISDRTTADLFYSPTAIPLLKRAAISAVLNTTFVIPALATKTVVGDLPIKASYDLWGVVPHMHLHGTAIHVEIQHPDGTSTCAVDIPAWNFHWQQFYYYQQAIKVKDGDNIHLTCTYDNTQMNQPTIGGLMQTSMPLHWGEKTTDEMCLDYLYFTLTDPREP
ncbi:MAG: hypothetical protein JWM82_3358 [Myxococcales bacterium]|nr:hypothetical protein [Myxococcales bacterium]